MLYQQKQSLDAPGHPLEDFLDKPGDSDDKLDPEQEPSHPQRNGETESRQFLGPVFGDVDLAA